ncbi:unnamed protein product [Sympodiomycopsis kandeliae]
MQFATLFAFAAAAAVVAAQDASPQGAGACAVGAPQCCNSLLDGADASKTAALVGLDKVVGLVGLQCQHIPVNVIGVAAELDNNCKTTPVCCTNTAADGLIHAGCNPISVN